MSRLVTATFHVAIILFIGANTLEAQQHQLTQLTFSDTTHDGYPYWSPDGNSIIYSSGTSSSCFTMIIPARGGSPEFLTEIFAQHARWSPHGNLIAFDGDFGTQYLVVPADGGQPVRVDPDSIKIHMSGMPCWSPDGKKIAFKSMYTIYILDLETGALTELFRPEGKNAIPFDWSADGSMILMDVRDTVDRTQSDIWIVPLDGSPKQLSFLPGRQVKPSLSPDGTMILFTSYHGGNGDLWVMSSKGGDPIQLTFYSGDDTNPGFDVEGSWSPDGKSLAFSSTRTGYWAVWRMDPDLEHIHDKLFGEVSYTINHPVVDPDNIPSFPTILKERPNLPSPSVTTSGREMVLVMDRVDRYIWFDATVENGSVLDYSQRLQGKGNQLWTDGSDFPQLADSGLHSDQELRNTKSITGRSISQITVDGRPGGSSGAGFLAGDETILSVLWSDNRLVKELGLTHPDLARPLLQLWNISNARERHNEKAQQADRIQHKALIYNGNEITVKITGSRGWQESIFNDEILGNYQLECGRNMESEEEAFLLKHYGHLPEDKLSELRMMLTQMHTGEMVPYYINRYGFYEGHTDFRAEPVSIAFIFGLCSLQEIHNATEGDLYSYLTTHFTQNP